MQREQKTSIQDIMQWFHVPLDVAAQKLGICTATIKRTCRQHGIRSWPFRKLRAFRKRKAIIDKGGRLTPSDKSMMDNCMHFLQEVCTEVLVKQPWANEASPSLVPAPSTPVINRYQREIPCSAMHVSSLYQSPATLIDAQIRCTVLSSFMPL